MKGEVDVENIAMKVGGIDVDKHMLVGVTRDCKVFRLELALLCGEAGRMGESVWV